MNYSLSKTQIAAFNNIFKQTLQSMQNICGGLPFSTFPQNERFLLLALASGISHNINWDFLCNTFMPRLINETHGLKINLLKNTSPELILKCCLGYEKKEKYDIYRRSKMIISITEDLCPNTDDASSFIKDVLSTKKLYGKTGCIEKLKKIRAFSEDPVGKKLNLLIQLLLRTQLLGVNDTHKLEATVDYHIIRVYPRSGRLTVTNKNLKEKLLEGNKFSLNEITELRNKINKIMQHCCKAFNLSMADLCFTDWAIGRTFCHYNNPECISKNNNRKCPYSSVCKSFNIPNQKLYKEPISNHGFY